MLLETHSMQLRQLAGKLYQPMSGRWELQDDPSVKYIAYFWKPSIRPEFVPCLTCWPAQEPYMVTRWQKAHVLLHLEGVQHSAGAAIAGLALHLDVQLHDPLPTAVMELALICCGTCSRLRVRAAPPFHEGEGPAPCSATACMQLPGCLEGLIRSARIWEPAVKGVGLVAHLANAGAGKTICIRSHNAS